MKNMKKILFCIALLFLLSGCLKTDIQIEVDASQKINVKGNFFISEEILSQHDLSLDQIIEESPFKDQAFLENCTDTQKEIDGKNYIGKSFSHELSIESDQIKTEIVDDKLELTINPTTIESIQFDVDALDDRKDHALFFKELGVEAIMTIKMPAKIIWSSIGEVKGNRVDIDLTTYKGEGIVVRSDLENHLLPYIIAAGAGAALIVGFLLFRKKKKITS